MEFNVLSPITDKPMVTYVTGTWRLPNLSLAAIQIQPREPGSFQGDRVDETQDASDFEA